MSRTAHLALDGRSDYPANAGDNTGIALGGTGRDRLAKAFGDLSEGGRVKMPLSRQGAGAEVGWLTYRFRHN